MNVLLTMHWKLLIMGLYKFTRSSLNEMLTLVDIILEGRELSDFEKHRYFVEE